MVAARVLNSLKYFILTWNHGLMTQDSPLSQRKRATLYVSWIVIKAQTARKVAFEKTCNRWTVVGNLQNLQTGAGWVGSSYSVPSTVPISSFNGAMHRFRHNVSWNEYKLCTFCENRASEPLRVVYIPHFDQISVKNSVLGSYSLNVAPMGWNLASLHAKFHPPPIGATCRPWGGGRKTSKSASE